MSTTKAIAYISRTNKEFSPQDLDHLLIEARNYNQAHDITGVLLHNPGFFFQYLEGPDQNVRKVYARVEAARSHQIIMELYNDKVVQRHFSSWHMGYCRSPKGVIQELSHMNWIAKVPTIQEYQNPPLGLQMLIKYWNNMASKAA